MNVSLRPELEKLVNEKIQSGQYRSSDEVFNAALQLLKDNPTPNREQIRKAIAGNTCRCTGYQNIFKAIENAATTMRSPSHAD